MHMMQEHEVRDVLAFRAENISSAKGDSSLSKKDRVFKSADVMIDCSDKSFVHIEATPGWAIRRLKS